MLRSQYVALLMAAAAGGLWPSQGEAQAPPAVPGGRPPTSVTAPPVNPPVTAEDAINKRRYPVEDSRSAVPSVVRQRAKPFERGEPRPIGGLRPSYRFSPVIRGARKPGAPPVANTSTSAGAVTAAAVTSCEITATGDRTNLLSNAGFETLASTNKAANWCDDYYRGYTRVATGGWNGSAAFARARVPTSVAQANRYAGPYQIVNLNQTSQTQRNVFIGGMVKGTNVNPNPDGAGAILDVGFTVDCGTSPEFCSFNGLSPDDPTLWCATPPSTGSFGWRWVGIDAYSCGVGYYDANGWVNAPIKSVGVYPILYQSSGTADWDSVQLIQYPPAPAAVTFQFDDGYASSRTIAAPDLQAKGYTGSAPTVSGLLNDTPTYMTNAQIQQLQNSYGWDIPSHSVSHPDMTTLTTAQQNAELKNSKTALQNLGLTVDAFVWPYGEFNQKLISLAQAGIPSSPLYKSTRTVEWNYMAAGTFPYAIKVHSLYGPDPDPSVQTTIEAVDSWLAETKDVASCTQNCTGRWLLILAHDVTATGSGSTYVITQSFLDQVRDHVNSFPGVQVMNYRQGLQTFADVPAPQ